MTAVDWIHSAPLTVAAPRSNGVEIDSLANSDWDRMLAEFQDAHYEQASCYRGQRGETGSHLLLRRDGAAMTGARVGIYKLPGLSSGLALVRYGPFWRRKDRPVDFSVYREAIAALVEEYCVRRGHCLTIRPRFNPEFYRQECDMLAELGFILRRPEVGNGRYLVDLALGEEAQLQNLGSKWRYNLKKAPKDFDIRLCETESDLAVFLKLFERMIERKQLNRSAVSMQDYGPELARLPEPIRARTVLVHHKSEPIAGATIGILGDTAYYVLGATGDEALKVNAGYAMHWWIVHWLSTQNVRWYDLGGGGGQGLHQFKQGLIGKCGVYLEMAGEYDRWTSVAGRLGADLIYFLRSVRNAVKARLPG